MASTEPISGTKASKQIKAGKPTKTPRRAKAAVAGGGDGFWDRPALMNMVSDLLFLFGFVALGWATMTAVQRLPVFPLRQVMVATPLDQVAPGQIDAVVQGTVSGNFFTTNLDEARVAFEKLPWVRRAEVRRRWPDGIEVAIEEHVAVARWKQGEAETRLVNKQGEVFVAGGAPVVASLPVFAGPEGMAAEILARHREFQAALAPLGREPHAVVLSSREAWELRLDDGLVLVLGRDQPKAPVMDRLARFTASYQEARERTRVRPGLIDMRYPNGFALRPMRAEKTT